MQRWPRPDPSLSSPAVNAEFVALFSMLPTVAPSSYDHVVAGVITSRASCHEAGAPSPQHPDTLRRWNWSMMAGRHPIFYPNWRDHLHSSGDRDQNSSVTASGPAPVPWTCRARDIIHHRPADPNTLTHLRGLPSRHGPSENDRPVRRRRPCDDASASALRAGTSAGRGYATIQTSKLCGLPP
ncbi:MAG: hypothetical protein R2838_02090 [Caldilineaceae bacterium]